MKYFITGATGFIGGRVARQLVEAGHDVVALVRTPAKAQELAALGVHLHPGDITDRESMREPMTGVDGLFHLAAWYEVGVRDSSKAEQINVVGTRNVLELMHELGIPKGVYTSTVGVFSDTHGKLVDETYRYQPHGPWISEYERTKWLAHYEVAEPLARAGLPLVIVQPGVVYGPGDTSPAHATFVQYLQKNLPMVPRDAAFCWGHVEDMAHGHILAMEKGKPGESYIIGGPVHTLVEVLALAEQITGIPAPRMQVGSGLVQMIARITGLVERVIPLPSVYMAESLRSSAATYIASNAKAQRELGFNPRSLAEGLPETLRYEMEQLGIAGRQEPRTEN